MWPLTPVVDWIERRCDRRTLARLTVGLAVALSVTLACLVWYFGSVGLSMGAMGYDDDERTVVLDAEDRRAFLNHYEDSSEEGWCLYGSTNRTHIRIEAVVPAQPIDRQRDRITFTCLPETGRRVMSDGSANLIGAVHSHPDHDESYLSPLDIAMFSRVSPLIEVMGVYTAADGVEFYTVESLNRPLNETVVARSETR